MKNLIYRNFIFKINKKIVAVTKTIGKFGNEKTGIADLYDI